MQKHRPQRQQIDINKIENKDLDYRTIQRLLTDGWTIFDLPLKCVAYSRVSTDDDGQRHSLSAQTNFFREYIAQNPNWKLVNSYYDEGISGTSTKKRKSFLKMIEDAENGDFNLIITKEVSRFARNLLDSISHTRKLLHKGIGVFFLSDNLITFDGDSELRLSIMASLAQEESRKTSNRVRFGQARSMENGVVFGSNRFYGYKKNQGKLEVCEPEAEMVRLIFDLYGNQGLGLRRITNELWNRGYRNMAGSHFADSTIRNILSNVKYIGVYAGRKTQKRDFLSCDIDKLPKEEWIIWKDEGGEIVPAIVDEELFYRVRDKLALSTKDYKAKMEGVAAKYKGIYSYSSKIVCEHCQKNYCRSVYRNRCKDGTVVEKEYWRCFNRITGGKSTCNMPKIYTKELNNVIAEVLRGLSIKKEIIIDKSIGIYKAALNKSIDNREQISEIEKQLVDINQKKEKLLDFAIAGIVTDDEFKKRNNGYNKDAKNIQERYEHIKMEQTNISKGLLSDEAELRTELEEIFDIDSGTFNFSEEVVKKVLEHIVVKEESTEDRIVLNVYVHVYSEPFVYTINRINHKNNKFKAINEIKLSKTK